MNAHYKTAFYALIHTVILKETQTKGFKFLRLFGGKKRNQPEQQSSMKTTDI